MKLPPLLFWKKANWKKPVIITASILAVLLISLLLTAWFLSFYYKNKVYGEIYLADQSLAGLSHVELRRVIDEKADQISRGVKICLDADCLELKSAGDSLLPGLSVSLFEVNREASFDRIYSYGRNGSAVSNFYQRLLSIFYVREASLVISVNDELITEQIKNYFNYREKQAVNADLKVVNNKLTVTQDELGYVLLYDDAVHELINNISKGDNSTIVLKINRVEPNVKKAEALNIDAQAKDLLSNFPTKWSYEKQEWLVDSKVAQSWLGLGLNDDNEVRVKFAEDKIKQYLTDVICVVVNQKPVEPKFTIHGNQAFIEHKGKPGMELDLDQAIFDFNTHRLQTPIDITLTMKEIPAQEIGSDIDGMEIVELLGVGKSSFVGSSANRRHNIQRGADTLNGTMIKPGEEFSLLDALGEIDGTNGYRQELVIKEGRTIPEYGGGLCQVGTTLFRAVFNTGLPVTARRNHSYRVQYYEPAGTDATIYDPAPDFKFVNDTPSSIIIKTKIIGYEAVFEFWGKSDGRVAEATAPVIYNIVKPGPTKIIETTELKPGERKCTEKAHNGADAYFDYKVTYANGEVKDTRFSSHYVPWREVCLVGVDPTATATSTEPVAPSL